MIIDVMVEMNNVIICNDIGAVRNVVIQGIGIGRIFEPLY